MKPFSQLKTQIFADCASLNQIAQLVSIPWIKGFTTNPSLMSKEKVTDYKQFAQEALSIIKNKSLSLEVFADTLQEMQDQAEEINSWGDNVYVKIPVMNTKKELTHALMGLLSKKGISINATAVFTLEQFQQIFDSLDNTTPAIISIFAGRIADTGRDPSHLMMQALTLIKTKPNIQLLWASPRELLNLYQADLLGCHIITMGCALLNKIPLIGKNLEEFSLETVKMFYQDALASNFKIQSKAIHTIN